MLRIGTIFSGVGAIEQALMRMNINHKIEFACDIGGVNIYKGTRPLFINEIHNKYIKLENKLRNLSNYNNEYLKNIKFDLINIEKEIKIKKIELKNIKFNYNFLEILNTLKILKPKKYKKINTLDSVFDQIDFLIELKKYCTPKNLKELNSKIINNIIIELRDDENFLEIVNFLKLITLEINRLDEIIDTQFHLKNLSHISSFKKKKEYVNNIYKNYEGKNFVKKSYLENYSLSQDNFHWNVSYLDGNEYKGKIDIFVGGSPCQSFSIAGKRKGFEDTRGTLFYEFIRLVKEIEPRYFIYENVKGLLNHDNGKTWKIVKESFDELGYYYIDKIFNAKDFGIPQNRQRIFVIGFKNKNEYLKFSMSEKKDLNYLMKNFLLDQNKIFLPNDNVKFIDYKEKSNYENLNHICFDNWMNPLLLQEKQKLFVTNKEKQRKKYTQINGDIMLTQRACQQYNLHGDFIEYDINKYFLSNKVKEYVFDTTSTFNSKNIENHINCDIAKAIVASSAKMHRAIIDNYIGYGDEISIKNRQIRRLHPRECFRLMGFSDLFKIVVSDTQAYHQAGNSIVVDVLIEILKGILK